MPRSTGAPTGGIPKAGYPGAFGSAFRRRSSWVIGRASAIFPNAEHGTTGVAPRLASPISGSRPCQRSVDRHLRDRGRRLYLWTASRAVRASYTTRRRPASGQYCCRFRQAIVEGHGQRHHSFVQCSKDKTMSVFPWSPLRNSTVPHSFCHVFWQTSFSTMARNANTLRHFHQAEVLLLGGACAPQARLSAENF